MENCIIFEEMSDLPNKAARYVAIREDLSARGGTMALQDLH